jgi:hypothetical protein
VSIAKVEKSVLGLIVGTALLGCAVVVAAPASADNEQNAFGSLRCNCENAAPAGTHEKDLDQGLRDGVTARSGRPVPMRHGQSGVIN